MHGRPIIYALLCLFLALGTMQTFAQEETETPLPPPIEPSATLPPPTLTPLPTNTATSTMTATATSTATSSPTQTLTATNTQVVPSETATSTLTPVASTESLVPSETATMEAEVTESVHTATPTLSAQESEVTVPTATSISPETSRLSSANPNIALFQLDSGNCAIDYPDMYAVVPNSTAFTQAWFCAQELSNPTNQFTIYLLENTYEVIMSLNLNSSGLQPNVRVVGRLHEQNKITNISLAQTFRYIQVVNSTLTLQNLNIINGYDDFPVAGGAITVQNGGQLTIQDSLLQNNHINLDNDVVAGYYSYGGAIRTYNAGTVTIERTEFLNNLAQSSPDPAFDSGGAIYFYNTNVSINCTNFSGNNATFGSSMTFAGNSNLTVSQSAILDVKNTNPIIYVENNTAGTINLSNNYWGGRDPSTLVNSSSTVTPNISSPLVNNPLENNNNPACVPLEPPPIPIPPTPTPVPTSTATQVPIAYKYQTLNVGTATWTANELQAITTGVNNVGQALLNVSVNPATTTGADVFNQVIVDGGVTDFILLIRADTITSSIGENAPDVTISYTDDNGTNHTVTYQDINNGNCKSFDSALINTTPRPRAIICNGSLLDQINGEATQYTIVHELGHLFDYRTGNALSIGIDGKFALGSCPSSDFINEEGNQLTYVIMGVVGSNPWNRGSRGWGSGPDFSNFQQNPLNTPLEAAADLFLNWIYRSLSPDSASIVSGINITTANAPSGGCGSATSESWNGFLNTDWNDNPPSYDNGLPGDIRFTYTIERISTLMVLNNW